MAALPEESARFEQADLSHETPSQLAFWHTGNWNGSQSEDGCGEWLRALRETKKGARQLIYQDDAIRGLVTFGEWLADCDGWYEGWGSIARLSRPVSRDLLRKDPRTAWRFGQRGIRALQGLPIRLGREEAAAIIEMAGGLAPTVIPDDEPDWSEEPILWVGSHGLAPESYIEAAVAEIPSLWQQVGFKSAPQRQVSLGDAGRADLLDSAVVGEAKRTVTLKAVEQIERYLAFIERSRGYRRADMKGVLLKCADKTSATVRRKLRESRYRLELWVVIDDGRWSVKRLA